MKQALHDEIAGALTPPVYVRPAGRSEPDVERGATTAV
jgi:hypothetical protein